MKIDLLPAPLESMPMVQNMARFYAYDLSKSCGHDPLYNWAFPEEGLYEAHDLSSYWKPDCYPFIIRIDNELGGFVLINKIGTTPDVDWNMGEFFIVGKFQRMGIGCQVAIQIFNQFPGTWEVMQMLSNTPAIHFWKEVISDYTKGQFIEARKIFPKPEPHENIVLKFVAESQSEGKKYDLIVTQFDEDRDKSGREKQYIDIVTRDLLLDAHILDVGCGMAEPIAKYLIEKGFSVTGIDTSLKMLELAKQRFPTMQWHYGDMRNITLMDKYDGIIAYDSFFHLSVDDQIKMIERFSLWLKPNGRLLISTGSDEGEVIDAPMHGHLFSYYSMSPEDYIKYFNLNKLEVVHAEEDQPRHRIWIVKKRPL